MLEDTFKARVNGIINSEIGVNPAAIDVDKPIRTLVSLDSMQFVGLVARIEAELDVELPMAVLQVNSLKEFYEIICAVSKGCN